MKSLVGVGMIGLPYLFMNFGIIISILLFLFVFLINFYTSYLLIKSKNLSGRSNYCSIANDSLGPISKPIINILIIILTSGRCMSELVISGTIFHNIVN